VKLIWSGWIVTLVLLSGSNLSINPRTAQLKTFFSASAVEAPSHQNSAVKKTAQFLEQFGGTYTKVSDAVWVVPFKGKAIDGLEVLVVVSPESNVMVIGATVVKKKNLKLSQPLLYRLLKYNHVADYVKVGFDNDDDLFVRADLNVKTLEFQSFKEVLEQVGAVADELYTQVKPDLIGTP
jgi:Putative bacterial sensory transduction regulator